MISIRRLNSWDTASSNILLRRWSVILIVKWLLVLQFHHLELSHWILVIWFSRRTLVWMCKWSIYTVYISIRKSHCISVFSWLRHQLLAWIIYKTFILCHHLLFKNYLLSLLRFLFWNCLLMKSWMYSWILLSTAIVLSFIFNHSFWVFIDYWIIWSFIFQLHFIFNILSPLLITKRSWLLKHFTVLSTPIS